MLAQMYAIEQHKLFRGKVFWGGLGLMILIGASVFFFMFTTRSSVALSVEDQLEVTASVIWPQALWGALLMMVQLGSPILLAIVGAAVAQEYGWRTVSLWTSHGVPRPIVLIARFGVLILAVLIFTTLLFIIIAAMSAFFTLHITGGLDPSVVNWGAVALSILRTSYVLMPYVALTFLFGVVTRSMVGAIGSGVIFLIIIEPVVIEIMGALGGIFHQIRMFLPDLLATSVFSLNEAIARTPFQEVTEDTPQLLTPGPAAGLIALYTVLLLALAVWTFRRQDLST